MLAPTPRGKARRSRAALTAFGIGSLVALTISTPVAASPNGQWYLEALHIRKAQEISTGDGVTVAIIDSGVDSSRPALKGQLTEGKCFGSAEDIEPTWDPNGHGTAMAGLIAGNGEDKRRILGVAPGSKIMPLCVSVEHTTADRTFEDITPAIRYAVDHGAKVVSMSLGALEKRASRVAVANLHAAVSYAERHDVVIVAAAGNAGQINATPSPASLPGVVAVTGTRKGGGLWKDSVPGKHVALAAPAENILTTYTGTVENPQKGPHDTSGYTVTGGTSTATALVAGAAALVRAKYPKLDAANVINRLIKTADHKGSPGRNPQYGYGIVDPVKALTAHVDPVKTNPLGQLQAPTAGANSSKAVAAPGKSSDKSGNLGVWMAIGAAVLVIIVVLIIVLAARARRRRATAGGWQPGGRPAARPGLPPSGAPSNGAAPPSGHPPNTAAAPPGQAPTGQASPRQVPAGTSGGPGRPAHPAGQTPEASPPGHVQQSRADVQQEPPEQYEIRWRKP